MAGAGVDRVVLVPPSWEGYRNDYALEAAQQYPHRFAVMGKVPLNDPASKARARDLARATGHARIPRQLSAQRHAFISR
jgi:predicted TIM-barrel fold metal-dependent hydrolase